MDIRSKIQAKRRGQMNTLVSRFSNANEVIVKGMPVEEFNDRYGVGFDVFTQAGLDQFQADAAQQGEDQSLVEELVKGLEEVVVLEKGQSVSYFVKRHISEDTLGLSDSEDLDGEV